MNILILNRIPYYKVSYHRGVNHQKHQVTYIGTQASLDTLPKDLPCIKIARPGVEATYVEVLKLIEEQGLSFDHVISLSEYELIDAAKVREKLGLKGASVASVEKVRDKVIMKEYVSKAGLRTPQFSNLQAFLANQKLATWAGKTVLKPIDGASSENIKIFESTHELYLKVVNLSTGIAKLDQAEADYSQFEIEEFVTGKILHIDGLIHQGALLTCLASCYIGNCLSYAEGQPLGSVQIGLSDELKVWTLACLKAVEITEGCFHLETIQSEQGLVFLEVANRCGGADVVKTFELATGIHLPSVELSYLIGEPVSLANKMPDKKYGWFVFPGHHLETKYCTVHYAETFKSSPHVMEWYELSADSPCVKHITYQPTEVPVAGVVIGDNFDSLYQFMQNMFANIQITERSEQIRQVA